LPYDISKALLLLYYNGCKAYFCGIKMALPHQIVELAPGGARAGAEESKAEVQPRSKIMDSVSALHRMPS